MKKKLFFLRYSFAKSAVAALTAAVILCTTNLQAENYALRFSTNSNLVNIGKPDYTGTSWTVELWAKRTGTTNHATFLAGTAGKLNLETWNATHKVGYSKSGDFTFNYMLPLNTWAHIAYVYNNGALSLYANGTLIGTATVTLNLPMTSIGFGSESFIGLMDEIRIWKTARTAAEIATNMNQSVNPLTETNLLAYWYFDDKSACVTDLSTNGAVGKIAGASYVLNDNANFTTTLPAMEILKVSCSNENEFYTTPASQNQELLCIKVQTQGVVNPIKCSELNITTEGTSDISDLENVSVYYTGTSETFGTTDTVQAKLTPQNNLKFSKEITLKPGTNYFWVAADVKPTAVPGHILDAGLQNVILNEQTYTPENPNPAGRRLINNAVENSEIPYVAIIPTPNTYTAGTGKFTITPETKILVTPATQKIGEFLSSFLKTATGYTLPVSMLSGIPTTNSIVLKVDTTMTTLGNEGYKLVSSTDSIVIKGKQSKGVFWGLQTLRQMLPVKVESKSVISNCTWTVPAATITDTPRFEYRGILFDDGRHFFGLDFLKKYIDLLSYYKLNIFHWHLVEDQGWRIEIKKYPKLQEIAAWRSCGTGQYGTPDGKPYGGYYTQEQVKELVAYAAERNIEIVPEIELPGHSSEILAAYPELACLKADGTTYPVSQVKCNGGIFSDVICGGKDASLQFYKDVLDEVLPLFPCKYVHIGGDEAPKDRWKTCPHCQSKIQQLGFAGDKKEEQLQRYIFEEIGKYLQNKGKEYIGWSEIGNSGTIPDGAILQDWIGGTSLAASTGHKIIRSSYSGALYISQRQSGDANEPAGPGAITTLEQTYAYEPVPSGFTAEQAKLILGPEVCLWTEWISAGSHAEYMTSPRMQAMAETGWSKASQKNITNFKKRMLPHFMRLNEMGQNYRRVESSSTINVYKKISITKPTVISSTLDGVSYFWNDSAFSTTKSITVSKSGTYKCYVDYFGIQAVITYEVTNTATDIKELKSSNIELQLYPNPARECVTVSLELKKGNGGTIAIMNSLGNMISEQTFEGAKLERKIKTGNLGKGLYLIQVTSEAGKSTQKLIIE